jgi:hypothetical protein
MEVGDWLMQDALRQVLRQRHAPIECSFLGRVQHLVIGALHGLGDTRLARTDVRSVSMLAAASPVVTRNVTE